MARKQPHEGGETLDRELLRVALDREPFAVAILSLPGLVFEYANPAFRRFAPGDEVVGRRGGDVFPDMAFLAPEVLAAVGRGEIWRNVDAESRIRRTPDGPLETVYGTFEVVRIDLGDSSHLLVSGEETTERVRLQQEYERLQAERARRLELAERLALVYRVIHSSLDYDEVMQRSLEEATHALGASAGAVFIGLDGESEARYVTGFPHAFLGRRFPAAIFPFAERLERMREPIAIPESEMHTLMNPAVARLFRVRSLLAIPIVMRGRLMGGIGLVYRTPHEFVELEVDFARSFGGSLSLALENADLYHRQERVADTLQKALLTLPDKVEGIEFAHAYRSATEAVHVGGDFYDLFELEHEILGVTLGDIAGKGLGAAVLTSLVKNAIRAQATEKRGSPADVMRVVNAVVVGGSEPHDFATVFLGMLDCSSGRFVYCNAGHTTAGALCTGGEVLSLHANSPIVGAFADSSFAQSEIRLDYGDLLFTYSDGLTEARSGKELFGEERVFAILREASGDGPRALLERMIGGVLEFTGGELSDDMAMLALRRTTE